MKVVKSTVLAIPLFLYIYLSRSTLTSSWVSSSYSPGSYLYPFSISAFTTKHKLVGLSLAGASHWMVYHIMPSSIVLLKSYTPAVLLLILPLPNFSAMCIFPQGQVWEVAEWVAQSGRVVIVETETEVLQLNRDIPPHAKHRK